MFNQSSFRSRTEHPIPLLTPPSLNPPLSPCFPPSSRSLFFPIFLGVSLYSIRNYESFIYMYSFVFNFRKVRSFWCILFWLFWCSIVRLGHMVCGCVHSFSLIWIGRIPLYKYLTIYLSYSCWIFGYFPVGVAHKHTSVWNIYPGMTLLDFREYICSTIRVCKVVFRSANIFHLY